MGADAYAQANMYKTRELETEGLYSRRVGGDRFVKTCASGLWCMI